MAMNRRVGRTPPDYYRREASTIRLDTGPYIGLVKNNLDPTRSGRLQVYIPDLASGEEDNPDNWRTVSYASPYFGSTYQPDTNKQNAFSRVKHTYGMWAIPPDIGNLVLCLFVTGDPNRGYWFACIPNQLGHFMIPAIAGSKDVDSGQIEDSTVKETYDNKPTVVAEWNENKEDTDWSNFVNLKKPIHEEQYKILLEQGLHNDYVRGIVSSTSQRETPSSVFGISTPGRPLNDSANKPDYAERAAKGQLTDSDVAIGARKGGHTFVMDDGNFQGKDRLIRLRTGGGHQILMNDSERVLYISNSDGSVWIEMTGPGHLNIYSSGGINVRSKGDLNFHSDKTINFNAAEDFKIYAGKSFQVQSENITLNALQTGTIYGKGDLNLGSDGTVNVDAGGELNLAGDPVNVVGSSINLNSGGSADFDKPETMEQNKHGDTGKKNNKWENVDGGLSSIVTVAPSHEPWALHANTEFVGILATSVTRSRTTSGGGAGATGGIGGDGTATGTGDGIGGDNPVMNGEAPSNDIPVVECAANAATAVLDPGPKSAARAGLKNPVNKSFMFRKDNPPPVGTVGPLTAQQTKALCTQIGWSESSWRYEVTNPYNYLGKYQMGAAVLTDQGYIKRDAYSLYGNKAVNLPTSWTGKDGITSKEQFLTNAAVQEKAMITLLKSNYNTAIRIGAIKPNDDLCTIAGILTVSHLLGAGAAKKWRESAAGQDANGTTGATYFNMGRYAVDVLATATV